MDWVSHCDGLRSLKQYFFCCFYLRQPVWQLERSLLPAACPGHSAGEEELEEERLWPSNAEGFVLLVLHRGVSGSQFSTITQHGGRSAKILLYPDKANIFVYLLPNSFPSFFIFAYLEENFVWWFAIFGRRMHVSCHCLSVLSMWK